MSEQRSVPTMVWIGALAVVIGIGFALASGTVGGAVIGALIAVVGIVRAVTAFIDYAKD